MVKYILVCGGVISYVLCWRVRPKLIEQRYRQGSHWSAPIMRYRYPEADRQASSTGLLLKTTGLKVTAIKIDPYMNIDAGTMAPTEHGMCSS